MKLSLTVSLFCLVMVGCAAKPAAPIQQPTVVTVRQLPPPVTKGEMVPGSLVIVEVVEVDVYGETTLEDYYRLSELIRKESARCACVNGDPLCYCKLPVDPTKRPQK